MQIELFVELRTENTFSKKPPPVQGGGEKGDGKYEVNGLCHCRFLTGFLFYGYEYIRRTLNEL